MAGDYKKRLKDRIAEVGLTDKEVCKRAGVSPAFLSNLWAGKSKQPGVENLVAVCREVGWKIYNLFDDGAPEGLRLTVQHRILSNEMWADREGEPPKDVPLAFLNHDVISLEIETDEYQARGYRRGDVVACAKLVQRYYDNLTGLECIVETDRGERLFKILARGSVRGRYTLRSLDPAEEPLEDVKIRWAAPVKMILRGMG